MTSHFQLQVESSHPDSSSDEIYDTPSVQRGRGRAHNHASPAVRRGRGRTASSARGRGRGRRAPTRNPEEFTWSNVDFSDSFDTEWFGEHQKIGVLIDTSNYKPVDFLKYFSPMKCSISWLGTQICMLISTWRIGNLGIFSVQ
jgi:hypothetical protein